MTEESKQPEESKQLEESSNTTLINEQKKKTENDDDEDKKTETASQKEEGEEEEGGWLKIDGETMTDPTEESDLSNPERRIWVVTTAALPWRTGTAVNPLLRALYLTRNRPSHYVTLVIPWLESLEDRRDVYGSLHTFEKGGQEEQEEWIRNYARERCGMEEEEKSLRIMWYKAKYHGAFGSIFPMVDISSTIVPPDEVADVAILEEPEHLNWFRVPAQQQQQEEKKDTEDGTDTTAKGVTHNNKTNSNKELGWTHTFRYVVGILHTNYSAYMKQYGIGTSIIAAPVLGTLSSLVVRAYCHRVIRLSAVLPSYAPSKEVTSNVHGVRQEFLDPPATSTPDSAAHPVYFIGKILWAKGFDRMLEIQEKYRHRTGEYFPIDIYGGGPDEKQVMRAFHGRRPTPSTSSSSSLSQDVLEEAETEEGKELTLEEHAGKDTKGLTKAAEVVNRVFARSDSLRSQSTELLEENRRLSAALRASDADVFEAALMDPDDGDNDDEFFQDAVQDDPSKKCPTQPPHRKKEGPLSILGDVSGRSIGTGIATTKAIYRLLDGAVKTGIAISFSEGEKQHEESKNKGLVFDPPKSRFELRRHALPARFQGVKDHVLIRDIFEHRIFLNPSLSEVLCTTTAEAIAMGKTVIIPNHPSNQYFLQFPNCKAYDTLDECVDHLVNALAADKMPGLSEEYRHKCSWEGATERLFESARITKQEQWERIQCGRDKLDSSIAWLHSTGGKGGRMVIGPLLQQHQDEEEAPRKEETKEKSNE